MKRLKILFFLTAICIDHIVEGAPCKKSTFGRWTCSPCGRGSRCHSCNWCTGFCYNGQAGKNNVGVQYGTVEIEYKIPFLDMFDDINVLLKGDAISELDVVAIYKGASVVTREDCTICNNSPELNNLSIFTDRVHEVLTKLLGTLLFNQKAIEKTTETKSIVQNLPKSLKIRVEPTSSLLESAQKGTYILSVYSSLQLYLILSPSNFDHWWNESWGHRSKG